MIQLPPKSILTNATAIVSACEWAEVSPDNENNSKNKSHPLKFVLVTELAALLHLGSYTHARHLWHRHRQNVNLNTNANVARGAVDPEMDQFQRLWKAAQPLLLASAAPSISSSTQTSTSASASKATINDYNNPQTTALNKSTQPQSQSLKLQTSRRQFYAQLRSSCIQTPSQQQPLATFANELIQSQRMHMVRLLEEIFDSIPRSKPDVTDTVCRLKDLLGFDNRTELEEFLNARDWHLEDEFWIPGEIYLQEGGVGETPVVVVPSNAGGEQWGAHGFGLLDVDTEYGKGGPKSSSGKDEKIHFLTHVVGFMERQGLDMTAPREGAK